MMTQWIQCHAEGVRECCTSREYYLKMFHELKVEYPTYAL